MDESGPKKGRDLKRERLGKSSRPNRGMLVANRAHRRPYADCPSAVDAPIITFTFRRREWGLGASARVHGLGSGIKTRAGRSSLGRAGEILGERGEGRSGLGNRRNSPSLGAKSEWSTFLQ